MTTVRSSAWSASCAMASSPASRTWTTSGRPARRASSIWAPNAPRWASRGEKWVVEAVRVVRVKADGRVHAHRALGEADRELRAGRIDADADDGLHADLAGLLHSPAGVAQHLEVTVGIDERHGLR